MLSLSSIVDPMVGNDYVGFIIFIKCLALCSMIASNFLMRDIYLRLRRVTASTTGATSWRQKVSLTQTILFLLSLGDFFSAFFVQFLSTWMVPSFVEVSLSSGTVASCTAQGVFGYFFYGLSAFSNASLAVAYSLIVKFGWRDNDKDRYRFPFTVTPIICSLIICIIPLFGKHYNYNGTFFCDISASPLGCDFEGSTTQCTRGANSRAMLLYVGVIPFMVAFAVIIAAVIVLIYSVLKQERRMDRYQHGDTSLNRSMTRQTTRQGIYYILAFGLAWLPWYIYAILEYSQGYVPPALGIIHYITMPLQGVFNSLVYFRPKFKSERANGFSLCNSLQRTLRISVLSITCCSKAESNQTSDETGKGNINGSDENPNNEEQKKEEDLEVQESTRNNNAIASNKVVMEQKTQETSVRFSDAAGHSLSTHNP